jgi:hypothetical protein
LLVIATIALACSAAGCGGSSSAATARPHTNARLEILSPTPNEVTGPNVVFRFAVHGAKVSPPDRNKLVPNEGHIHVSLDGKLVDMAYGLTTHVTGLSQGTHTVQAEFVANDHLPFADRVIAISIFTVRG